MVQELEENFARRCLVWFGMIGLEALCGHVADMQGHARSKAGQNRVCQHIRLKQESASSFLPVNSSWARYLAVSAEHHESLLCEAITGLFELI